MASPLLFCSLRNRTPALTTGALLTLASVDAAAQAGGGGNFGGGGGGGGEFEIIFHLVWQLLRFTIHYPQFGIPIWIVIGVVFYYTKRGEKTLRVARTIRKGRKVQEKQLRAAALADIERRDPAFSQAVFLERSDKGFLLTQRAWSDQQLRHCRAFISDGVFERFELYVMMQKKENVRNRLRDVRVRSTSIIAITCDVHFDTIHVQFVAQAVSYDEDLTTGQRVGGNSEHAATTFSEVWSFSRRTGVATQPEAALVQGNCPNCGGTLDIVDVAKCGHCESLVNSGQYDWVLSEITQTEEWVVPPVTYEVTGWDALRQSDPALNFQHLEDRASVMFWRCMMAQYFDNFGYAAPILARERNSIPNLWALPANQFWKTPAVGTVEVSHAQPATETDHYERVHVLVRWSGRRAEGDRREPRYLYQQRVYSHMLVLKRRVGAHTKIEQAFASFNCHSCGAPVEIGKEAVCRFCETTLNDGALDWVLENVNTFSMVREFRREDRIDSAANLGAGVERLEDDRFVNEPELLGALARIVMADGVLHDKERHYLERLAQRRGVPKRRLAQILHAAGDSDQPVPLPKNPQQAEILIDHLVRAALVDGRITRGERTLLVKAGERLNWSEVQLKAVIMRNREELYRQAKKILKNR